MSIRLQKFLAEAGVASRRAAEEFITQGRVRVNGEIIRLLGTKVDPHRDSVEVDGKVVRAHKKIYLALHKPAGYVCSHKDEEGRRTIYDLLPTEWRMVSSVGRLDYKSEGLIFLTNDGEFALRLTHPRYGIQKKYVVGVEGEVTPEMVQLFKQGIYDEGEKLQALSVHVLSRSRSKSLVEMTLAEGKNREIRRMFETQGMKVKDLVRVQIGKIKLGELKAGRWRTLTSSEIKSLTTDL